MTGSFLVVGGKTTVKFEYTALTAYMQAVINGCAEN